MFVQTHLARENACKHSFSTARRICTHLHLGACPGPGLEEGAEEPTTRISFRRVFLLPSTLPFSYKSTQAGVLKRTGKRGTRRSRRTAAMLRYSTPFIPRPGSSLTLRARALQSRTVHSCGSGRAASSFLPVLSTPGPRAGARSRRELSGNPPRGGWPGALTSS